MVGRGKIREDSISRVREIVDIVEVVSGYMQLKRSGQSFLGVCPFHDDHDPSLNVSPKFGTYRCFACGAKGSVFDFVMHMDRVDFREAVELLAERHGITLDYETPEGREAPEEAGWSKSDLVRVHRWAAEFFRRRLAAPDGEGCRAYLDRRGITEASREEFGIGYAPGGWDQLVGAARRKGIPEGLLVDSGLAASREGGRGIYDRFRDRLVFPIRDGLDRVIAFGARSLDGSEPKYLNSPETLLFSKRRSLYGIERLRELRDEPVMVMEGYTDVIRAAEVGGRNAVATLGTALTEEHARVLARYTREVVLVFDGDAAGRKAAERGAEVFAAADLGLRVSVLPGGQDPCDFLAERGPEGLTAIREDARDFLQFAIGEVRARHDLGGLDGRVAAADELLRMVAEIANPVKRGLALEGVAAALAIGRADLEGRLLRLRAPRRKSAASEGLPAGFEAGEPAAPEPPLRLKPAQLRAERAVLRGLIAGRRIAGEPLLGEDFLTPFHRDVFRAWESVAGAADPLALLDRFEGTRERAELSRLLPDEEGEERDPKVEEAAFLDALRYLTECRRDRELEALKRSADPELDFQRLADQIRRRKLKSPGD
ncbi:MAG: DNA primase [Planctomycetota bacterium]